MADLHSLIRLHKHELDEKRRVLGEFYSQMAELERQKRDLERAFEAEKEAMKATTGDVHFTFAGYAAQVAQKREQLQKREDDLQKQIDQAKDSMMESFSELKKYEMTQAQRDRIEEDERAFKEAQAMDAIGLENFRRKSGDEN